MPSTTLGMRTPFASVTVRAVDGDDADAGAGGGSGDLGADAVKAEVASLGCRDTPSEKASRTPKRQAATKVTRTTKRQWLHQVSVVCSGTSLAAASPL